MPFIPKSKSILTNDNRTLIKKKVVRCVIEMQQEYNRLFLQYEIMNQCHLHFKMS